MRSILLDRRRFLTLAAASGMAAAGAAAGWRPALSQDAQATTDAAGTTDGTDVITAMASKLGHDPERIFRFVQEEVRYEPYAGILRGANGTLVARAGNSADQALLLAALLRASDVPVRFVSGAMDTTAVDTLMATTVVDADTATDRVVQSLLSDEDVASGIGWKVSGDLTPEEVAGLLDLRELRAGLERDGQVLGPLAAGDTESSIDIIQAALATSGVELPPGVSALPGSEQEQHVWVEAQEDGGAWIDLDPTFADLAPGQSATTVAETVETLPDELRHLVDFTVIGETLTGGTLTQEPLLEASFFADELAYRGVLFGHVRAEDLQGVGGGVNILGSGMSDGTGYNALLMVGPLALVAPRSMTIGGGGGGGGLLGFGGGGDEGLAEGETSAEWLDVAVSSPGREPVVARRAIFDRVGTALRESGAVDPSAIPAAELVDLGDGFGEHYLPMRSVRAFSVTGATPNVRTLVQELAPDDASAMSMVPAMFDTTRALLGADVGRSFGSIGFPDTPAVTSLVVEPTADGTNVGLDVWHRPFGTVGLDGVTTTAPPAMVAGVIPHAVERVIIGGDPASVSQPAGTPISVGAVFESAAAQGIPTRLLTGGLPTDSAYDPESQRLLRQAIQAGQLVVIPERAVDLGGRARLGWWLVDPVSGATVDQMDDGGGQGIAQKAIVISIAMLAFYGLQKYGPYLLCLMGINTEATTKAMGKAWQGDTSETPRGCSVSGPPPPPPDKTMKAAPTNSYTSGSPDLDKAQQQWLQRTKDKSLH
jgi:hypothetical protein